MGPTDEREINRRRTEQCMENIREPLLRAMAGLYGEDVDTDRIWLDNIRLVVLGIHRDGCFLCMDSREAEAEDACGEVAIDSDATLEKVVKAATGMVARALDMPLAPLDFAHSRIPENMKKDRTPVSRYETMQFALGIVFVQKKVTKLERLFSGKLRREFPEDGRLQIAAEQYNGMRGAAIQETLDYVRTKCPRFDEGLITRISGMHHEERVCHGSISFSPTCICDVLFREKILFSGENTRYIRKLMEMTEGDGVLNVINDESFRVRGLARKRTTDGGLVVEFAGYMSWTLALDGQKEMVHRGGQFYPYRERSLQVVIGEKAGEVFGTDGNYEAISGIIHAASQQKHGTIVVVMAPEDAAREADRWVQKSRAIAIRAAHNDGGPVFLHDPAMIHKLTAIDGALLIDTNGFAYCVGAILDGRTVVEGNRARGSRYNSARNYVHWRFMESADDDRHDARGRMRSLAVVISQDGMQDVLIPDLRTDATGEPAGAGAE